MHEIIKATYELIDELEKSNLIKNLTIYKEKVKSNSELCNLIDKGKNCEDKYILIDIKRKLYQNDDYKNYIKYYNELFYIIMNINHRYQKLLNDKQCRK